MGDNNFNYYEHESYKMSVEQQDVVQTYNESIRTGDELLILQEETDQLVERVKKLTFGRFM